MGRPKCLGSARLAKQKCHSTEARLEIEKPSCRGNLPKTIKSQDAVSFARRRLMKEEKMTKLIRELLRDSRRSDRELARAIGASQPTVTRNRKLLANYIRSYTIVPEFEKVGYEILAITFAKAKTYERGKVDQKLNVATKWVMNHPNVFFASDGEGLGKDAVIVSVHKNYSKYADFMRDYTVTFADFITDVQSFVISLKTGIVMKPFDIKYIADDIEIT